MAINRYQQDYKLDEFFTILIFSYFKCGFKHWIQKSKLALLHSDSYLSIFYQFIYLFSKLTY